MPEEKTFEGDFLFVNHNAKQMKASTHRKKVFSHVQNKYRSWKRQEGNRALKASIKTSLSETRPPEKVEGLVASPSLARPEHIVPIRSSRATPARDASGKKPSHRITIRSLITEDDQEPSESALVKARTETILARLISPNTILQEGNSDPFNTYAVKIDPLANEVLRFRRDIVLPAIYHTAKRKWMTSAGARQDWQHCIYGWGASGGLGDEGSGTAFLATCATVASLVSPNPAVRDRAAHFRSKTLALLRNRLADGDCDRQQIYWHINIVVDVEAHNRNKAGATVHLNMLRQFFERDGNEVDLHLLLYVIYHDIHVSAMFLTRPVFDMERWVPARFQPFIDAAEKYLPDLSEIKSRFLDPSIDNPKLRALFIERRESLAVWLVQNGAVEGSEDSSALLNWLQVRVYLHQAQLINLFLQAETRYKAGFTSELINTSACQAYLSLATLLYIRSISFNATVHGVRLLDATATILTNMQEALVCSETPRSHNYEQYENARLWALYVGASAELFMGKGPDRRGWFTINFGRKAVRLGLDGDNSWDKVRKVLRGFLYTDLMHPDGEEWFRRVLETAGSNTIVLKREGQWNERPTVGH
ncbi:hypothetical protein H2200_009728 [Cladophialophora chaetospira]|uniref:Transcription factor domain-containing protein n=1 Tax=Cladophialophora chaetospira TaxID=386627 RepID=A0AA38X2Z2_9EURO|nr:hypothetical protein H2200_009728 [Cladophialophora chaetospira]